MKKSFVIPALAVLLVCGPSSATQTVSTLDGATNYIHAWPATWNAFLDSALTSHSSSSRPSYAQTGLIWYNSSERTFYVYDGASDIRAFSLDTINHYLLPQLGGGASVLSSGSTTDIGAVHETYIQISGTSTISSFGSSAKVGEMKVLSFQNALTISYNASTLVTPGGTDLSISAGDSVLVLCTGYSAYRIVGYQPASGFATSSALASYAPLASPALTGNPTAPTQTTGNNSTRLATTAFVQNTIGALTNVGVEHQIFNSVGTWTWTKPSGAVTVMAECWGGGGSGNCVSGSGSGGGGGAYAQIIYLASALSSTETVVVGSGGAAVTTGTGNNGGDSYFSSSYKRMYGYGGKGASSGSGGAGGTSFFSGGPGGAGGGYSGTGVGVASTYGGGGGAASLGSAGSSIRGGAGGTPGVYSGLGNAPSGGGAGCASGGTTSGAGAIGLCIITTWK